MANLSEDPLREKLVNHIQLKLSASLFMLLNNVREMQRQENPFQPYETPDDFMEIENVLLNTVKNMEPLLKMPVNERMETVSALQGAKIKLVAACESFYCYFSLNAILTEIIVDYRRLRLLDKEEEASVDFHQFLHHVADFIEKDEARELQAGNISYMMKCFPLSMTREKYADYVEAGLKMLFDGESEAYINNISKALKFRFLPVGLENYGAYFPQQKDYFNTLIHMDFDKMDAEELEELSDGLEENLGILDRLSGYLALMHESINFTILALTFSKDLDYLLNENMVYKDAFYYATGILKNKEDEALSEDADEMFGDILMELIDAIIADEKTGLLEIDLNKEEHVEAETLELYQAAMLITHIYYELLADIIYSANPEDGAVAADAAFIQASAHNVLDYMEKALEGLSQKTVKLVKRLFLTCIPSPYSVDQFMNYAQYVMDNTIGFGKKIRILDSVGMVFDATGFADELTGHKHGHQEHHHSHEHPTDPHGHRHLE